MHHNSPSVRVRHAFLHTADVTHFPSHTHHTSTAQTGTEGGADGLLVYESRGELHPEKQEVHELLEGYSINQVWDQ